MPALTLLQVTQALTDCILAKLVTVGAETPERVLPFNPGEIADDQCDCGLLAITSNRIYFSNTVISELPAARAQVDLRKCGAAYRVHDLSVRIMRCVPGPGPQGAPPTPVQIAESAVVWQRDSSAVLDATICCLGSQEDAQQIGGWVVLGQTPAGPAGLCVGSVTRVLAALFNCPPCGL